VGVVDWSKIREIDRRHNSEHPWITIAASVVILVIGAGIMCGTWALEGVAGVAREEGVSETAVGVSVFAWFVYGIGGIFLSGGVLWLGRGARALWRGERVRTDE